VTDFDVVIAGAGPAGCASAISLADFAPELRVCLVDGGAADGFRIGETVPPPIRPMLKHLGLFDRFMTDSHHASYRTLSAWGDPRLVSNEFLFQTHNTGWRLDRARFDAMMREAAVTRAAGTKEARVEGLARNSDGWRVSFEDGASCAARFVIDATGQSAALARKHGLRATVLDRLIGCAIVMDDSADDGDGLLIETFADGWWYTAALPHGRRIIACMTDADEARRLRLRDLDTFMRLLDETQHARVAAGGSVVDGPTLWPAGSRCVSGSSGVPLLCVGDAALSFDPVSGQGIVKALCSGVFASYAAADWLRQGDARGLVRYWSLIQREFDAYRTTLRDYYLLEQRWADRPFWRRRHALAVTRAETAAVEA